ncbi:MAG: hypothetical protein NC548_55610 [Lachnospiraceae bacterium]|nr:hypothetical protein [Lachnospiraceae bacterium]
MKKIAKAITTGILISTAIFMTSCSGISDNEFDEKEKQAVELELENSEAEEFEREEDGEITDNARAIGGSKMRGGHSCSARHKSRRRRR